MHGDAVRAAAGLDANDDLGLGDVEDVYGVRVLGSDVGSVPFGQEADPARAVADLYRLDNLPLGQIDDVDAVRFFTAHVEPFSVRTEHRMLRILAAHLHSALDVPGSRIDEQDH